MKEQLFVYGSLRDPAIQQKIIGRTVEGRRDILEGYTTSTVQLYGTVYPILVPDYDGSIEGFILFLTKEEVEKIDAYETDAYERVKVTLKSGEIAWVYRKPDIKEE